MGISKRFVLVKKGSQVSSTDKRAHLHKNRLEATGRTCARLICDVRVNVDFFSDTNKKYANWVDLNNHNWIFNIDDCLNIPKFCPEFIPEKHIDYLLSPEEIWDLERD